MDIVGDISWGDCVVGIVGEYVCEDVVFFCVYWYGETDVLVGW